MKISGKIAALIIASGLVLASCQGGVDGVFGSKGKKPIPQHLLKKIEAKGMTPRSPVLLRIFKEENVLELWKATDTGRYALLHEYEICKWSGKLGPKFKEGDRQAPEGFYTVSPAQMNPNSGYHLSFNIGYPNVYDRSHGRTGSHLMVHGACSSAGCYSMTDEYVEEIYTLARESFAGGQRKFQVQAYPFRMTPENLVKHVDHPHFEFWKMLKEGNDHFLVNQAPPKVDVCEQRYVFNRIANDEKKFKAKAECPASVTSRRLALAFNEKQRDDQKEFDAILKKQLGSPFVPEEKKPKTLNASILAVPTIGQIVAVAPPKPEIRNASASEESNTSGNSAKSAVVNAGGSSDPFTVEARASGLVSQSDQQNATEPVKSIPIPTPRQPQS